MCEIEKISNRFKIRTLIFTVFLLFFLTDFVYGSLKYYYLHVGSFRAEDKATQFSRDLQKKGLETVVRGEEIPGKGFWYRIYIGPFYSRLEAELESRDLKGKGIVDYAAIHKHDSLLLSSLEEEPEPMETAPEAVPEKAVSEITPPPEKPAPVIQPLPPEPPPVEEKPVIAERPAEKVAPVEEKIEEEITPPPPLKVQKPARKVYPKPPLKSSKRGYGRNMRQWGVGLGAKYTYRDIETTIIKRNDIPFDDEKKGEFPTQMHLTTLQLRLGFTNFLEIFGKAGTNFNDTSELGFAYGGGLRLNLFEIRGFYSALQGEYLSGDFEEEYISDVDNKWKKDTEWEEINAKVELGFVHPRFAAYIGGTFLNYNEDTKRQQLEGLPTLLTYQDEIEEENSFGAYAGIAINLTPGFIANLEGEALTQKSISVTLEYLF
ncbi:MAG: SPOR domain-containing protein [bacterium]